MKEAIVKEITSFEKHFTRSHRKYYMQRFSSSYSKSKSRRAGDLKRISSIKGYVQCALQKKQLIASFAKLFIKNDENTVCIVFQFHNPKLI